MMTRKELLEWTNEHFYHSSGKPISARFREGYLKKQGVYEAILFHTSFFPADTSIVERIVAFRLGLTSIPSCLVCNARTKINTNDRKQFNKYCSISCSAKSTERIDAIVRSKQELDHDSVNEKRKNTMLEKYGVETNSQRPEVKKLISQTTRLRIPESVRMRLDDPEWIHEQYVNKMRTAENIAAELGIWYGTVLDRVKSAGIPIRGRINESFAEREIKSELISLGVEFEGNNKNLISPYELDIFIPESSLAIEYCGLWFHSEEFKNRNYHRRKHLACLNNNVQLITIFEDEWINRRLQVLNFLKSKLGKYTNRIFARKTQFRRLDLCPSEFFESNHLQGAPKSSKHSFGLFAGDELVAAVSFAPHHRNGKDLVLNRLAFASGWNVVGGASKLVKGAIEELQVPKIITWSDNRWSTGKIYETCGFKRDGELPPDYSYINRNLPIRKSKQSMKKSETGCPKQITEKEWCNQNGWFRIWDCGKIRWVWTK